MTKAHPDAEIFPPLSEADYDDMKDSIAKMGLLKKIELLDGLVIDGIHREKACEELGIEPEYIDIEIGDMHPAEYVWSCNGSRRQMSTSQKAAVVAMVVARTAMQKKKTETAEELAKAFKVSPRSVRSATKIDKEGSAKLKNAVVKGDIAVGAAAKLAELPKSQQDETLAKGAEAVKEKVKKRRPRVADRSARQILFEARKQLQTCRRLCFDAKKKKPCPEFEHIIETVDDAHAQIVDWEKARTKKTKHIDAPCMDANAATEHVDARRINIDAQRK